MSERPRRWTSYALGAVLVAGGFAVGKLPNWLVRTNTISLFEVAQAEAALLHVTDGCRGSKAALHSYVSDPSLAAVVIPVVRPSAQGKHGRFERLVCDLGRKAIADRVWWTRLVERDVACQSLWSGEAEFVDSHALIGWPQFSYGDEVIMNFDEQRLRTIGVERVRVGDHRVWRGLVESNQ